MNIDEYLALKDLYGSINFKMNSAILHSTQHAQLSNKIESLVYNAEARGLLQALRELSAFMLKYTPTIEKEINTHG